MERQAMEQINKNLGEIRELFYKNKKFIGRGYKAPPEFELKGYDDDPTPAPRSAATRAPEEPQPKTQEPAPGHPAENTGTEPNNSDNAQPEAPEAPEPAPQAPAPEQAPAKPARMLSRLSNDLNGPTWNIEPLRKKVRYVAAMLDLYETPGTHEGSPWNTEEVPEEEPNPGQENPEAPGQEEP